MPPDHKGLDSVMVCTGCGRGLCTLQATIDEDTREIVYVIGCDRCEWRGEIRVSDHLSVVATTEARDDA